MPLPRKPDRLDLNSLPGHTIRRLQQIAVAVFMQETEAFGLTPVQYAALQAAYRTPEMDQRTLADAIGLDSATTGGVLDRLEARGLLQRERSETDRRARLVALTDAGREIVEAAHPAMLRAQERMLEPLPKPQRAEFMRMLQVLVEGNAALVAGNGRGRGE